MSKKFSISLGIFAAALVIGGVFYFFRDHSPVAESETVEASDEYVEPELGAADLEQSYDYPEIIDDPEAEIASEESTDEMGCTPTRTFMIKDSGAELWILAAYKRYFEKPDFPDVTLAFCKNAAFTSEAEFEMGPQGPWTKTSVMIGNFAQDFCYTPTVIYQASDQDVVALMESADFDFSMTGCELSLPKDKSAEAYCVERAECFKNYFANPDNRKALLDTKWDSFIKRKFK